MKRLICRCSPRMPVLVALALCLCGCGGKSAADMINAPSYVEEEFFDLYCRTVADTLRRTFAAEKEDSFLLSGHVAELDPVGDECARFVLEKGLLGDSPAAVVSVEDTGLRTRVVVYQEFASRYSRDRAALILNRAAGM